VAGEAWAWVCSTPGRVVPVVERRLKPWFQVQKVTKKAQQVEIEVAGRCPVCPLISVVCCLILRAWGWAWASS
jgi:hypothetical protein